MKSHCDLKCDLDCGTRCSNNEFSTGSVTCDACGVVCQNTFNQAEDLFGAFDLADTIPLTSTSAEGLEGDVPGDVSTTQVIRPGDVYAGTFDMIGDNDFVRVELEAGTYYAWDLDGPVAFNADIGRDEERGFVRIQDADGNVLTPNWRDVYFAPEETETYYLDVFSKVKEGSVGDYTLEMLEPTGASDLLRTIRSFATVDDPNNITVAFDTSEHSGAWSAVARDVFEQAYDIIESVIDVNITTTTDEANADWLLRVKTTDSTTSNFDFPGFMDQPQQTGNFAAWRIAAIEEDTANGREGVDPFQMGHFLHELGHALGLAHTHDRSFGATAFEGVASSEELGAFDLNQKIWSIISYNGREPGNATMAALDIAALQDMYGANTQAARGPDTYRFSVDPAVTEGITTIWDNGGFDTISVDPNTTTDVTIDLRPANLQYRDGGGGWLSSRTLGPDETFATSGFTIANSVDIEEAIGGRGNDFITGHDGENRLWGADGSDSLRGLDGRDTIYGGRGDDILDGGAGIDFMDGGWGSDIYYVDDRRDVVDDRGFSSSGEIDRVITTADFNANDTGIEVVEARGDANLRLLGNHTWGDGGTTLIGNSGNNQLVFRNSYNTGTRGEGADQFVFEQISQGIETDTLLDVTITDFASNDILAFSNSILGLDRNGLEYRALTDADVRGLLESGRAEFDSDENVIKVSHRRLESDHVIFVRLGEDADLDVSQIYLY